MTHGHEPAVALIVFRRPAHTAQVFERIRRARPRHLIVIADGPRPGRQDDWDQVATTREITEQVDWPCHETRIYSDTHLGCDARVVTGLNEVFSDYASAIVLEDDCVPDPSFFAFAGSLLERFERHPRVMSVGGHLWHQPDGFISDSYWFSSYPTSWGWATWSSSWSRWADAAIQWTDLQHTDWLERRLGGAGHASAYWRRALEHGPGSERDWTHVWALAHWLHDGLSVRPSTNLIRNVGFDSSATHTHFADHPVARRVEGSMPTPLTHPAAVEASVERDAALEWWEHSGILTRQLRMAHSRLGQPRNG